MSDTLDGGILAVQPRRILNKIGECYTPGSARLLRRVRYLVVHHCSLSNLAPGNPHPITDELLDAPALAGRFRDPGLGTGSAVPYHGLTTLNGINEQMLPLSVRGSHASGYNGESVAWCIVGEHHPAEELQLVAAAGACALIVMATMCVEIVGHTDLAGASRDPKKRCPRPTVDPGTFRAMVLARLPGGWRNWPQSHRDEIVAESGLVM